MTNVTQITDNNDTAIIDRVRRGRIAALAGLRAKTARTANVVSIFENTIQLRAPEPVFHSKRAVEQAKLPKLLLTNPIAA